MSLDTLPRTRARDGLLDLLRTVSIVRVVIIHALGKADFWFWPAPTYVMPGMPAVFFVSGSLAYKSLRAVDGVRRTAREYWRRTFRRLLVPYWAYYSVIVVYAVGGDLTHPGPRWDVDYGRLALGATGLIVPDASRAMRHHTGHLWFMSVFLVLAFVAPFLVRAFERARWLVLVGVLVPFVFVQWLVVDGGMDFDVELEKLTTFAVPYVVGFWYTDGALRRASLRVLLAAMGVAVVAAWWWNGVEPGAVNGSQPKHLLVGAAWLAACLAIAPTLRTLAARHRSLIDRISRRTFTIFLWGWTTCVFAADWVDEVFPPGWPNRLMMLAGSLTLLAIVVPIFGKVEDWSARPRQQVSASSPAR